MGRKDFLNLENTRNELLNLGVETVDDEISNIEKQVKSLINGYKSKNKIAKEQYKEGIKFSKIYQTTENLDLPDWVLNRLQDARLIGNSYQTIIFPNGEKYQINNALNNLSATDWLYFTTSVFSTFYTTNGKDSYAHNIRKIHPTPKPPQLRKDIIQFFTKENELIFDYFMGVGGSLLGAGLCGRQAIGIDLNQKYIEAYKLAAKEIGVKEYTTVCNDCLEILQDENKMQSLLNNQKISLVLIDPPYANMMNKEKTGADINIYGKIATPFSNDKRDFGNLSVNSFYDSLKKSIELVLPYIQKRGYIVIFVKDLQPTKKETNLLHANIIQKINEIKDVNYKGLRIWVDRSAKLFPYGYPFAFVANQINQYIMVFRKEK